MQSSSSESRPLVAVLPISGGRFPIQLAGLRCLAQYGFEPQIVLASSGGSVATYTAAAGHWQPTGITRVAASLDSQYFIRSWFSSGFDIFHSAMAGIFYGAIYQASDITLDFFRAYFTPKTITKTEVWVGAVNYHTGEACLFCNRDRESAHLQGKYFNPSMFKCEPLRYLGGSLKKIMNASMASSSVPLLVEARPIDQGHYIDCGTKFASPLTPIQDEIKGLARQGPLHLFYINGHDVEADTTADEVGTGFNIFTGTMSVTEHLVRGFIIHDRTTAFEIINNDCGTPPHHLCAPIVKLGWIMSRIYQTRSSLLEIYPLRKCKVLTLTNFTGEEIVECIDYAQPRLGLRLWWNGEPDLFSSPGACSMEV